MCYIFIWGYYYVSIGITKYTTQINNPLLLYTNYKENKRKRELKEEEKCIHGHRIKPREM